MEFATSRCLTPTTKRNKLKLKNTRNNIKKYTVAKTRFSLTHFKYLFYIPTRLLVIFNYEIREVIFYDFIAEMFAIALHFYRTIFVFLQV